MSLKSKIIEYLNNTPGAVHGGEIERIAQGWGYKASTASRRCRELADEGKIERAENEKGQVVYRRKKQNLYTKKDQELNEMLMSIRKRLVSDTANLWYNQDKIKEIDNILTKKKDYKILVINKHL
jgi:CTP-dependent riboflavin kinase